MFGALRIAISDLVSFIKSHKVTSTIMGIILPASGWMLSHIEFPPPLPRVILNGPLLLSNTFPTKQIVSKLFVNNGSEIDVESLRLVVTATSGNKVTSRAFDVPFLSDVGHEQLDWPVGTIPTSIAICATYTGRVYGLIPVQMMEVFSRSPRQDLLSGSSEFKDSVPTRRSAHVFTHPMCGS